MPPKQTEPLKMHTYCNSLKWLLIVFMLLNYCTANAQISNSEKNDSLRVNIIVPKKTRPIKRQAKKTKALSFPTYRRNLKGKKYMSLNSFIIDKNVIIRLPKVIFKGGTHELVNKSALGELNYLVEVLKNNPNVKIEIQGHTCCTMDGRDSYNSETGVYNLSVYRAYVVCQYLIKKGIEKSRLEYKGFGSSQKIISNDLFDVNAAKINRRVEVEIIDF